MKIGNINQTRNSLNSMVTIQGNQEKKTSKDFGFAKILQDKICFDLRRKSMNPTSTASRPVGILC